MIAAPDEFYTQVPVAFVVRRDESADLVELARELRGMVGQRIGDWARLTRLVFVSDLTYTPSKKIRRSGLRDWLTTDTGLDVIADIRLAGEAGDTSNTKGNDQGV
ncbi:hypothetical protein AGRA3207_003576 [Actinomadura graeca]|uniref:AMP-binding enzyme C-terminal domain-containing protein n=1 Tax=Actinomadura graeca TaxID=2750812 RepID=A0ABX8QYM5_9ACTN|nr:hypothetical protein [Actinomadura graeca]QXJ22557.1 hypothetical protein AGRA3207_003576 [Actinomadura graeca]